MNLGVEVNQSLGLLTSRSLVLGRLLPNLHDQVLLLFLAVSRNCILKLFGVVKCLLQIELDDLDRVLIEL